MIILGKRLHTTSMRHINIFSNSGMPIYNSEASEKWWGKRTLKKQLKSRVFYMHTKSVAIFVKN